MSGVDYSKWDKMVNEMSDSDDDGGGGNNAEVTTFDEPQSVTFGGTPASQAADGWDDHVNGSGGGQHTQPTPPTSTAPMDGSTGGRGEAAATEAGTTQGAAAPRSQVEEYISDEQLARNGAAVRRDDTDGGRPVLHYVWRQAREEVTVVVPVPPGTRAGDVEVSLRAKSETMTEGVADILRVSVKTTKSRGGNDAYGAGAGATVAVGQEGARFLLPVLDGELAFQAKLEAEGEGGVDWQLKDYPGTVVARDSPYDVHIDAAAAGAQAGANGGRGGDCAGTSGGGDRRGVEIVLKKHCPIPNAVMWWKSLLKGGPEIDVSAIKGRAANNHQSVWEEALGMFKEKVAARKAEGKISVDTGE
ncbi:unnamed protein product [Pylaiella littoralis]